MHDSKSQQHHRKDIDGLRSIAVLSVVFFHLWPKEFNGGFVGVDIFFVLSGYLISLIILKETSNNSFSIFNFYKRRMKRILPMMYIVISSTLIVAYFVMLPLSFTILSKTSVWTSAYLSNMYFIFYSLDYFNNSTQSYPLLHTWTLAVEEQFYVFWPLLLLLLSKKFLNSSRNKLLFYSIFFLLMFFAISFAINSYNKNMGYYLLFSRAFEFLIGGVTAIVVFKKSQCCNKKLIGHVFSILSLVLIICSVFFFKESLLNNALLMVVPTFGTSLYILAGHYNINSIFNKILSGKLFVFIGLISYSLYLWHWPIIAFWHYLHGNSYVSAIDGVTILLISVALSILSYYIIENKTRYTKFGFITTLLFYQVVPMLLISSFAFYVQKNDGLPERIKSISERQMITFLSPDAKNCFDGDSSKYDKDACIFGDANSSQVNVLLIGDSHAANYFGFWNELAKEYGFKFKFLSVGTCNPIMNIDRNNKPQTQNTGSRCAAQVEYFTKNYANYKLIVVAGAWGSYLKSSTLVKTPIYKKQQEETFRLLNDKKHYTLVMSDIPYLDGEINNQYIIINQYLHLKKIEPNYTLVINTQQNKDLYLMTKDYDYVHYFDVYNTILKDVNSYPIVHNLLVYTDSSHLNQVGASNIALEYLRRNKSHMISDILESSGAISH